MACRIHSGLTLVRRRVGEKVRLEQMYAYVHDGCDAVLALSSPRKLLRALVARLLGREA